MEDTFQELDRKIADAHSRGDARSLAHLYAGAAQRLAAEGELDRAAFLFVNAYVWALDAGEEAIAAGAHEVLRKMGRER